MTRGHLTSPIMRQTSSRTHSSVQILFAIISLAVLPVLCICKSVGRPLSRDASLLTTRAAAAANASAFGWKPCPNSQDDRWKCGSITVPFDYHNASEHRTMQIETVLFQAGKTRSNHTILINPGGPGESGVEYAWYAAEKISSQYSDNTFDVLGFDPRGVNASTPHIYCYPSYALHDRWSLLGSVYREKGDKLADLQLFDSYYEAVFRGCREKYGDVMGFLSTALVARDMDTIRAALGEEQLYYLGMSYGTDLGETYSQMYPDKVGRMILDGVDNIIVGRTATGYGTDSLYDITKAYTEGFIGECVRAGPQNCALAAHPTGSVETAETLQRRLDALFAKIIDRPVPGVEPDFGPGIVRYQNVANMISTALYGPSRWPGAAQMITELEAGNATALLGFIGDSTFAGSPGDCAASPEKVSGDAAYFVICGDAFDAPHPDIQSYLDIWKQFDQTAFLGEGNFFNILPCRHFDWKTAEVYRGDLKAKLANPILLISGTHDPATPLLNGQQVYEQMGTSNARLVVHHGYGHTSVANPSNCTEKIKKDYMLNGVLPSADKPVECFADDKPYPAPGATTTSQVSFGANLAVLAPPVRFGGGKWRD